jgi:hypothetical protein
VDDRLTRDEALRVLHLSGGADPAAVKRAYRRLAREHHPDRGGDPSTFQRLQRAYERLVTDPRPPRPRVARGRPSRPDAVVDHLDLADVTSVAWDTPAAVPGDRLERDGLIVALARPVDGPLHAVGASSRAPGSRFNGLAPILAGDLASSLHIRPSTDDRGRVVVATEIRGTNRSARRALDRAELDGAWLRTRTSSSTVLRATLEPSDDRRRTALRTADRLAALLERLDWPLAAWTVTDGPG